MTWTPQDSRCWRRISKISGKEESSATTLAGRPRLAMAAATASLLPTCPATTIIGRPERLPVADDPVDAVALDAVGQLLQGPDWGAASAPPCSGRTRGRRAAPSARRAGGWRQAQHVPEVDVGGPALGRPGEVASWMRPPITAARDRGRHVREDGGRRPVADDRRLLDDARGVTRGAGGAPRAALRVGHLVAVAFVLAAVASALASFLDSSLPVSVSLSSPRMNASTRSRATSSWSWSGGLFMK